MNKSLWKTLISVGLLIDKKSWEGLIRSDGIMFKAYVKKEEGRQDWTILSFGKQWAGIWGLGFFVCPEKPKKQEESPSAGDFLMLRSKIRGKVAWEEPTAGVFVSCPETWRQGEKNHQTAINSQHLVRQDLWQRVASNDRVKKEGLRPCRADPMGHGTWDKPLQLPVSFHL